MKKKFVIISGCRFGGKHYDKGDQIELDLEAKKDCDLAALLSHAGRIAVATPEVIAEVQAEIKAEKKREAALARWSQMGPEEPEKVPAGKEKA